MDESIRLQHATPLIHPFCECAHDFWGGTKCLELVVKKNNNFCGRKRENKFLFGIRLITSRKTWRVHR